jgi:hypothetical protein
VLEQLVLQARAQALLALLVVEQLELEQLELLELELLELLELPVVQADYLAPWAR